MPEDVKQVYPEPPENQKITGNKQDNDKDRK